MIGNQVRRLRQAQNLTMIKLAEKCNISQSYISDIENNIIKNPSIDMISKIAKGLGVDISDLINNYESPKNALGFGEARTLEELESKSVILYTRKIKIERENNIDLTTIPEELKNYIDILNELINTYSKKNSIIYHKTQLKESKYKDLICEINELTERFLNEK